MGVALCSCLRNQPAWLGGYCRVCPVWVWSCVCACVTVSAQAAQKVQQCNSARPADPPWHQATKPSNLVPGMCPYFAARAAGQRHDRPVWARAAASSGGHSSSAAPCKPRLQPKHSSGTTRTLPALLSNQLPGEWHPRERARLFQSALRMERTASLGDELDVCQAKLAGLHAASSPSQYLKHALAGSPQVAQVLPGALTQRLTQQNPHVPPQLHLGVDHHQHAHRKVQPGLCAVHQPE